MSRDSIQAQAFRDAGGHLSAHFRMRPLVVARFARVMEQQRQIENIRTLEILQEARVGAVRGILNSQTRSN